MSYSQEILRPLHLRTSPKLYCGTEQHLLKDPGLRAGLGGEVPGTWPVWVGCAAVVLCVLICWVNGSGPILLMGCRLPCGWGNISSGSGPECGATSLPHYLTTSLFPLYSCENGYIWGLISNGHQGSSTFFPQSCWDEQIKPLVSMARMWYRTESQDIQGWQQIEIFSQSDGDCGTRQRQSVESITSLFGTHVLYNTALSDDTGSPGISTVAGNWNRANLTRFISFHVILTAVWYCSGLLC